MDPMFWETLIAAITLAIFFGAFGIGAVTWIVRHSKRDK